MAQYTCNANMAADLLPMLAKARLPFSLVWPRPDVAVFEGDQVLVNHIKSEATFLNLVAKDINFLPTGQWTITDDMAFPLTSPADLREGFEPTSNLNLWEDATHQITFDGGKHWTNVFIDECTPPHYVACSDGKRSWPCDSLHADRVVKRPNHTVTGRISDPQPQPQPVVYGGHRGGSGKRAGLTHGRTIVGMADGRVEYRDNERTRKPASVGESPACDYTDTCFDSDPSVVGE